MDDGPDHKLLLTWRIKVVLCVVLIEVWFIHASLGHNGRVLVWVKLCQPLVGWIVM